MNYKKEQFEQLKVDTKSIYLPTIKVVFGEHETNWLSITFKQLEKIKSILVK